MVYSAARVPAERAIAYGLVSDVAPEAELDARVEALCQKLLTMPDIALEGVKDYLKRAMTMTCLQPSISRATSTPSSTRRTRSRRAAASIE